MDKKIRIDEEVLKKIKKFRSSNTERSIKYPSDKHLVHMAVLEFLKKEGAK
ncbi:hypothetical protein ACFLZZ_03350 [Nanoarchaeota archaeon]